MNEEFENKLLKFKFYSQRRKAKVIAHYFLANMNRYVLGREWEDCPNLKAHNHQRQAAPLPVQFERDEYWEEKSVEEWEIFV